MKKDCDKKDCDNPVDGATHERAMFLGTLGTFAQDTFSSYMVAAALVRHAKTNAFEKPWRWWR